MTSGNSTAAPVRTLLILLDGRRVRVRLVPVGKPAAQRLAGDSASPGAPPPPAEGRPAQADRIAQKQTS